MAGSVVYYAAGHDVSLNYFAKPSPVSNTARRS
jgi:hypothetical protein